MAELKRRNVWRAAALYVGAVWALAQGVSQLTPALGLPDLAARWFVIAAAIGFPLWIAFAWLYEFTPHGFRRDAEIAADAPIRHSNARKLDFAIIAVMAIAIVLLASGYFIHRKAPAVAITAKSIAVLPFENLSSDKQNDYFVSGMQDLILTKLADVGSLKVISRTSTMQYKSRPENLKQVGEQLGVATILEGSVQKAGNEVLINVQLIDTRTDSHIWAESYTRTLDNIFGVEGEVAGKIATALNAKLSPAQSAALAAIPTTNRAAYDAFLRGEYQFNKGFIDNDMAVWKAALPLYRQAMAADPKFALALAQLSITESILFYRNLGSEDAVHLSAQSRADAERALALQPDLPEAQLALGYYDYYGRHDYAGALTAFAAALKLKPNDADALSAQGYVQRRMGQFDAAIASLTRAVALDPRNFVVTRELGMTYMMVGRYREAEPWLARALALQPDSTAAKDQYATAIFGGAGDIPRALSAVQGDDPEMKSMRAWLLSLQRKFPEAIALIRSIPDTPDNFDPGASKAGTLAQYFWVAGDTARARELYAEALPLDRAALPHLHGPGLAGAWINVGMDLVGTGQTAEGLAAIAKAQVIVATLPDVIMRTPIEASTAQAYAMAARADLAVPLLAKLLATRGTGLDFAPVALWLLPGLDPIRNDPGFKALQQQYAKYKPAVTYDNPPASSSGAMSSSNPSPPKPSP
ncbi:MAG: tetratricopeptide repeat protein [Proteobacteria bacterium]|nr:tetratricopeptide repeat protein [Pseudomonadota bacterium]